MQAAFTIIIFGALGLIIWYLIEIRAALVKRGKVACWYCGNYFPANEVEVHGSYTYCSQHGSNRQKKRMA
jgi:hypothetical protein